MARKTDYYLSQCASAASKSSMTYHLGAVLVKGGKVISTGYNHHRTHYDGNDILKYGHRKPASMHAEMHAIFSLTGMSPSFKQQVQLSLRRTAAAKRRPPFETCSKQARLNALTQQRSSLRATLRSPDSCCAIDGESSPPCDMLFAEPPRGWDARRRDSRVNGADIYVARVIKNGLGSAKPCWRYFEVLKVNEGYKDYYETHTDVRLFGGLYTQTLSSYNPYYNCSPYRFFALDTAI
ncbi:uncharacterized protein EDB91DRAFT_1238719 [Suillus paluster]|uniref:uncharacterized protein n=1 Tax=Suillus paluster TaxID=48578 RepID=UPI001B860885|nr:uncharacterized protein EDB91DRAFT_1238719 [Suillus paluster]KAG1732650.1 hypothetical protein EDB91DRAFT_1238719 [Suillus paluster]